MKRFHLVFIMNNRFAIAFYLVILDALLISSVIIEYKTARLTFSLESYLLAQTSRIKNAHT